MINPNMEASAKLFLLWKWINFSIFQTFQMAPCSLKLSKQNRFSALETQKIAYNFPSTTFC